MLSFLLLCQYHILQCLEGKRVRNIFVTCNLGNIDEAIHMDYYAGFYDKSMTNHLTVSVQERLWSISKYQTNEKEESHEQSNLFSLNLLDNQNINVNRITIEDDDVVVDEEGNILILTIESFIPISKSQSVIAPIRITK